MYDEAVVPLFGSGPDVIEIATENLKDAYEVANSIGLFTWLSCGTCLGYHRDKNFISHDDDIDLGANISDLSEIKQQQLIDSMQNKGFNLCHILGDRDGGIEISFTRKRVKTEWFFHYRGTNCVWCAIWYAGKKYYCYSPDIFDEFVEAEFKGVKVNVLKKIEKYLEEQYGEWKIPVTPWHCGKPPCIRKQPIL